MTTDPEPFEQPPEPPKRRCASALAQSILTANPTLADKSDRQLVFAHHRTTFNRAMAALVKWVNCQADGKARDDEYDRRCKSLAAFTLRVCRNDLFAVRCNYEDAARLAAACVAGELEYMQAMDSLKEELFA